jgi:FtsH-binding integral membrane protein
MTFSKEAQVEKGSGITRRRWYFWLGLALICSSGIFLALVICHSILNKPDLVQIISLVIIFIAIPAGPGICLLMWGRRHPAHKIIPSIPALIYTSPTGSNLHRFATLTTNSTRKVSRKFYLGTTLGAAILLIVGGTLSSIVLRMIMPGLLGSFIITSYAFGGLCLSIYVEVVFLVMLFKAWHSLRAGHPRTTPGKAVGFLFIPFFNLYWVFQSVRGFAADYNTYINQSGMKDYYLGNRLFTSFAILFVVTFAMCLVPVPFLNFFLAVIAYLILLLFASLVIGKLCDAINHLIEMGTPEIISTVNANSAK